MKTLAALLMLITALGNIYGQRCVVNVSDIPGELNGCPFILSSLRTGKEIDSLQALRNRIEMVAPADKSEICEIVYSYPIENGIRSYHLPVFLDSDTITIAILDFDNGIVRNYGGNLNGQWETIKSNLSDYQQKDSTARSKLISYITDKAVENRTNALGAYLVNYLAPALEPEDWLELYYQLSSDLQSYPMLKANYTRHSNATTNGYGKKIVNISLDRPDGKAVNLYDYLGNGKYLLIDFWASWCGPCKNEASEILLPLYNQFKDSGKFEILGIMTSDTAENHHVAIAGINYPWPQLIDTQNIASETFGFRFIPYTILVAPDGTILQRNLHGVPLKTFLENLLK